MTKDQIKIEALSLARRIVEEVRGYTPEDEEGFEQTILSIILSSPLASKIDDDGARKRDDGERESEGPGEDDLRYRVLPPSTISEHLENQVLDPTRMVAGREYVLTPGQRAVLRERYGMTPARTVVLVNLALWEGTQHPKSFVIRSGQHVGFHRRHVLVSATISDAGRFFRAAEEKDREAEDKKPKIGVVKKVLDEKGRTGVVVCSFIELPVVSPTIKLCEEDRVTIRWREAEVRRNAETGRMETVGSGWIVTKRLTYHEGDTAGGGRKGEARKVDSLKSLTDLLADLDLG